MIFVATQNRMATAKYTRRVMLISFFDTMFAIHQIKTTL